jgi:4-amino-4-deoxy-L-arabinose transferase-like glycosyltransferase
LWADLVRRFIVFAHRLVIGLSRPKGGQRRMIGVLAAYWAVWTLYGVIAKSSQGIHTDMGEVVAWSWELEWGTPKHPPFLPALVRAWFTAFPLADWAYYLLAIGLIAVAIYFSWLMAGFWLRGPKRAAVPFLLMLIPFYNFLALRLDHNVALIPLWAIATYAFARAFLTRNVTWSVATGIAAGAAVLAKYWSFFLLFGLIVAALADRRRLQFLKSPAPWIMTVVSFGIFLPHLIWLDANGYPTLAYAKRRIAETWPDLEDALTNYTFGTIAYVAVPLVLWAILVRPTRQALRDTLFPRDDDRRFAATMFWTPLLVAIPFALLTSTGVNALWTMSELSLFGVVLLSSPLVQFPRSAAAIVAMVAMLTSSGALLAAPFVAYWKNRDRKSRRLHPPAGGRHRQNLARNHGAALTLRRQQRRHHLFRNVLYRQPPAAHFPLHADQAVVELAGGGREIRRRDRLSGFGSRLSCGAGSYGIGPCRRSPR